MHRKILVLSLIFAAAVATFAAAPRSAHSAPACSNTCSMSDMPGMTHMGGKPDMASMGPHMTMTPGMPAHVGDAQRAAAIVNALRNAIERYKNYRVAEQDGYVPFLASLPQKQYQLYELALCDGR